MIDPVLMRQAVFYLGLSELVEGRLAASPLYRYAVAGLDASWRWVESHDVSADALANLFTTENGDGVAAGLAVETDRELTAAWGCSALAVAYTAFAAYSSEGKTRGQIREDIGLVADDANRLAFISYFRTLIPLEKVLERYDAGLDAAMAGEIKRSAVRDHVFAVLHTSAPDIPGWPAGLPRVNGKSE